MTTAIQEMESRYEFMLGHPLKLGPLVDSLVHKWTAVLEYYVRNFEQLHNRMDKCPPTLAQLGKMFLGTFQEQCAIGHDYVSVERLAKLLEVNMRFQVRIGCLFVNSPS